MQRIHITRNQPGPRATVKHNEDTSAYIVKERRGDINWYQYQEKVLKPFLLPFAKRCLKLRPNIVVQEDKALSHNNRYVQEVFDAWEIQRLLWPGNSPDLNAIESIWFWIKRETTKKGLIIEQSLYYRRRHKYGEIEYVELYVESVYVKRWEGPSYREPPTAIVKAPKPGPQGLRPIEQSLYDRGKHRYGENRVY